MYNKGLIISGLAVFVLLVTFPIWFNGLDAGPLPKPELPPGGEKECVAPAAEMRDSHMQLLNVWRDDVLRNSNRKTITVGGKEFQKGLQLACMQCHSNKEKFCDTCHEFVAAQPTCWDCHISPTELVSKKEAQ